MHEEMRDWVTSIIQGVVSRPEEVRVEVSKDDMGVLFTVKVNPDDNGRIIGRQGEMAKAIRTLLRSYGMARQIRASMKIDAPGRQENY